MQILLYNWSGEPNRIDKPLTAEPNLTLTGTLREECSVEEPSILVQSDPRGQNYAYIPEFSRYYYITDITAERSNAFRIRLRVDVLMSYKSQILALPVFCMRSAILAKQSPYIIDEHAPINAERVPAPINGRDSGGYIRDLAAMSGDMILITVG